MKSIIPKVIKKKKIKRSEQSNTIVERRARENAELLRALHNSPFEVGYRASLLQGGKSK